MIEAKHRKADPFGIQRVLAPRGQALLPLQAEALDPALPIAEDELLIEIESLNINSSAFRALWDACGGDATRVQRLIEDSVARKGKLEDPVTGAGGMLVGRVAEIGPGFPIEGKPVRVGDRVATLVSLAQTPLSIRTIRKFHSEKRRVDVEGHAILFASGCFARIPEDLPETIALAALDVAVAPAQMRVLAQEEQKIVVIGGGGKAGLLALYQAKQTLGVKTIALDSDPAALDRLTRLSFVDEVVQADATQAVEVMEKVWNVTKGGMADLVMNVANAPGTEIGSILACKNKGTVCFFNLAADLALASMSAAGVGAEIDIRVASGCIEGHVELTLDILRDSQEVRQLFNDLYG